MFSRQRFDGGRVDLRERDVAHHHRADTGVHRRFERHELDCVQALATHVDLRQSAMRIDGRIAVSGKMFRSRDRARILRTFCKRGSKSRDVSRIFSVRTDVDHGIGGVVVDVDYGREDLLDTECACFACGDLALASRVFRVTGGARPPCSTGS